MMVQNKPIIIIPGFNGSLLVKKERRQINFFRRRESTNLVNPANLRTNVTNDVINYKLLWKMTSNQLIDPNNFVAFDFGGVEGICDVVPQLKTLDNNFQKMFNVDEHIIDNHVNYSYFKTIVTKLMNEHSYEPRKNLIGLPYDYRYIGDHGNRLAYYKCVKQMIEDTTHNNNKSKVVVLAHSLGGMLFHDFLVDHVSEQWKCKHISEFITVNTPFGGVPQALFVMFDKSNVIYNTYRHFNGLHLCFPNDMSFSRDEALVTDIEENECVNVVTLQEMDSSVLVDYDDAYKLKLEEFRSNMKQSTNVKTTHLVSDLCSEQSEDDALLHLTCITKPKGGPDSYVYEKTTGDGLVPYRCMMPLLDMKHEKNNIIRIACTTHTNIMKHPSFLRSIIEALGCQN